MRIRIRIRIRIFGGIRRKAFTARLQQRQQLYQKYNMGKRVGNASELVKWTTYGCRYRYKGNGSGYGYRYIYSYSYSYKYRYIYSYTYRYRFTYFGLQIEYDRLAVSLSVLPSLFSCVRVCFMYYELKIPVGPQEYAYGCTYSVCAYIRTYIHTKQTYINTFVYFSYFSKSNAIIERTKTEWRFDCDYSQFRFGTNNR